MSLVVTSQGEVVLLSSLLGQNPLPAVNYRLYSNNWVPTQQDDLSNYTELTLAGYAPITVNATDWTIVTDSLGGAQVSAPEIAWLVSAAGPTYGYYVTDPADSVVLWAEYIPGGPYNFLSDGSTFSLVPSFSAD